MNNDDIERRRKEKRINNNGKIQKVRALFFKVKEILTKEVIYLCVCALVRSFITAEVKWNI